MDKEFGFIQTQGDKDLFFPSSSLQGVQFEEFREGLRVAYTESRVPEGCNAENVQVV